MDFYVKPSGYSPRILQLFERDDESGLHRLLNLEEKSGQIFWKSYWSKYSSFFPLIRDTIQWGILFNSKAVVDYILILHECSACREGTHYLNCPLTFPLALFKGVALYEETLEIAPGAKEIIGKIMDQFKMPVREILWPYMVSVLGGHCLPDHFSVSLDTSEICLFFDIYRFLLGKNPSYWSSFHLFLNYLEREDLWNTEVLRYLFAYSYHGSTDLIHQTICQNFGHILLFHDISCICGSHFPQTTYSMFTWVNLIMMDWPNYGSLLQSQFRNVCRTCAEMEDLVSLFLLEGYSPREDPWKLCLTESWNQPLIPIVLFMLNHKSSSQISFYRSYLLDIFARLLWRRDFRSLVLIRERWTRFFLDWPSFALALIPPFLGCCEWTALVWILMQDAQWEVAACQQVLFESTGPEFLRFYLLDRFFCPTLTSIERLFPSDPLPRRIDYFCLSWLLQLGFLRLKEEKQDQSVHRFFSLLLQTGRFAYQILRWLPGSMEEPIDWLVKERMLYYV